MDVECLTLKVSIYCSSHGKFQVLKVDYGHYRFLDFDTASAILPKLKLMEKTGEYFNNFPACLSRRSRFWN